MTLPFARFSSGHRLLCCVAAALLAVPASGRGGAPVAASKKPAAAGSKPLRFRLEAGKVSPATSNRKSAQPASSLTAAEPAVSDDPFMAIVLPRLLASSRVLSLGGDLTAEQRDIWLRLADLHFNNRKNSHESVRSLLGLFRQAAQYHALPPRIVLESAGGYETGESVLAALGSPVAEMPERVYIRSSVTPLEHAKSPGEFRAFLAPEASGQPQSRAIIYRGLETGGGDFIPVEVTWLDYRSGRIGFASREGAVPRVVIDLASERFLAAEASPQVVTGQAEISASFPGQLWSLAVSKDGRKLAIGADDGSIRVLDAATQTVEIILKAQRERISALSFLPDGTSLVAGSFEGAVRLWDFNSGEQLPPLRSAGEPVTSVAVSGNGSRVVIGSVDRVVTIFDLPGRSELAWGLGHDAPVTCVCFSPDGTHIASGSADRTIRLWDAETGRELSRILGHGTGIQSISFSPDGAALLSSSGGAALWQGRLAPGLDSTARVWSVASGEETQRMVGHGDWLHAAIFSPDGRFVVTASGGNFAEGKAIFPGQDLTVRVWAAESGAELARFSGFADVVSALAFSPNGETIYCAGWDGTLRIIPGPGYESPAPAPAAAAR